MRTENGPAPDPDDVFEWPDGDWCYRHEYPEMGHKSDDYRVLYAGDGNWDEFVHTVNPRD